MIAAAGKPPAKLSHMETLYDMHCHLGFVPDPAATATAGAAAGVHALSCTVSPAEYERLQKALATAPNVVVGLGAHPWWVADGRIDNEELDVFCKLATTTRFVGEIGLDFAGPRDAEEDRTRQIAAFKRILSACNDKHATEPKLISLHAVNAAATVLDLLEATGSCERHRCIFHWFSGTSDDLRRALHLGCFFSVGPRMLASRRGREYARQIPLNRLLLETDMPSREDDVLAANVWRAELNNALSGITQLKLLDHRNAAEQLARTSVHLLAL